MIRPRPSARLRLTLLYSSMFAACGAVLVAVTYGLLASNLSTGRTVSDPATVNRAIQQCVAAAEGKGIGGGEAKGKCAATFQNGVNIGATAQRGDALDQLLGYSIVTLAATTALAAAAGWYVAGRILRPVRRLTDAARNASEHDLSHRLALTGPRDELRELADTFDDMLARLERAFASQRQFIANASHELRTPLTVMRTAIDVVLAKPDPTTAEMTEMGIEVRHALDHAEQLLAALLALARSQRAERRDDPLDLAALAEDALEDTPSDGLTTLATLETAPVNGDAVLLERLVGNLLDNAARYNAPGGTIAVSTGTVDGTAKLRVVNTGAVVSPDEVERLFLPFTRLDDRTRHDGFGLGLALVRSIATLHQGTVTAAAVPTGGLDITVDLPSRGVAN